MNEAQSVLLACLGEREYQEAWRQFHSRSFRLRFWGKVLVAAIGLSLFLWQQWTEPTQWWASDTVALLVLVLSVSQAAGPLFYLLFQVTQRVFFTQHYREALREGRFYLSFKSTLWLLIMTALSVFTASGLLGSRWYIKPLVFLLAFPAACFWLLLPAVNWLAVRVRGQSKKQFIHKRAG